MHQIDARLDPEIRAPNWFTTKYQIYICKRYFFIVMEYMFIIVMEFIL